MHILSAVGKKGGEVGAALVLVLAVAACSPPSIGGVSKPGQPGSGGAGGAGSHPGAPTPLPPPVDGGPVAPMCGPQLEGPPIPCPDAARPPTSPPPRDAGAPPPPPRDAGAPATPPDPPTSMPPPVSPGCEGTGAVTVKVRAWGATPTCVYLKAGETAQITANGRWRAFGGMEVGPEGRSPNYRGCPRGSLVARVAKFHQRTCIGASGRITAQREGYLWLYQSEGWDAMASTGEIEATITGGGRSTRWPEGMTPFSLDPRVEQARVQSFEPVCGRSRLQVYFGAQNPNHPRVLAYVQQHFGGDPEGWISRALVRGCAYFYATPAEYTRCWGNNRRGRLVHWVGDNDFPGPSSGAGDFNLRKTIAELTSMQPDYGPFGGPPVSIMHEAGHWIAPDGCNGKLPKWLGETYAELLPSQTGDDRSGFHNGIDNPESVRFGATWWWCDGTFGGPTFVDYIDNMHPGFVHGLTKVAIDVGRNRPWPGSSSVFQMLTGRSFDDLLRGYQDAYNWAQHGPNRPVTQCLDPRE